MGIVGTRFEQYGPSVKAFFPASKAGLPPKKRVYKKRVIYPHQEGWLKVGDDALAREGGRKFYGKVSYIGTNSGTAVLVDDDGRRETFKLLDCIKIGDQ